MIALRYLLLRPFKARDRNGANLRNAAHERRLAAKAESDPVAAAVAGWKLFLAGGPGLKALRQLAREAPERFFAGADAPLRAALAAWDAGIGGADDGDVLHGARAILDRADGGPRDALTAVLALRLFHAYGRRDAFVALTAAGWGGGLSRGERDYAHLRLHRAAHIHGPTTMALYDRLLASRGRWSRPVSTSWFQDMLIHGMPRAEILDRTEARIRRLGLWRDALAVRATGLALELGQEDRAAGWIRRHRALAASHDRLLAVADLLSRRPALIPWRLGTSGLERRAELFRRLVEGERRLAAQLRPAATSIAVVGNGPADIGRGRGAEIDGHDRVVRFNRFSTEPPHDADYGTRVDIVVRSVNATPEMDACSARADLLVFCRRALLHQPHRVAGLERAAASAKAVAFVPTAIYDRLTPALGTLPSKGLLWTAHLAALRGRLDRRDFYGFSMIDQIGPNPTSSHYFEQSAPGAAYDWRRERALFDGMFEDAGAAGGATARGPGNSGTRYLFS